MTDHGLTIGTPELDSVGPITFGPDSVLFIADNLGCRIVAVDVADDEVAEGDTEAFELENVERELSAFLGCARDDVTVRDVEVHPRSHNVYLSVSRGQGSAATPLIVRIDRGGAMSIVELRDIPSAAFVLNDAPDESKTLWGGRRQARSMTITDLAYVDGTLFVAGMTNEEFSSTLRRIPFPFDGEMAATSLEIFHVSHGQYETAAPINTFVPAGDTIIASYTCTPVVRFSVDELRKGGHVHGTTVAELGNMNQPLDMVSFTQAGHDWVLISNTRHPLLKIACDDIAVQDGLTTPQEPLGVPRQAVDQPGVTRMANLNGAYVLALQTDESGDSSLRSLATASL